MGIFPNLIGVIVLAQFQAIGGGGVEAPAISGRASPICARSIVDSMMKPYFKDQVRVAAVQYPIEYNLSRANLLDKISSFVTRAKGSQADLVVFPELIAFDLYSQRKGLSVADQLRKIAEQDTPQIFGDLSRLAVSQRIAILGGSFPRIKEGRIYNTSLLALSDGTIIYQDKTFLTEDEKAYGFSAGEQVKVFDAPWGRTAILICYDCEVPSISADLAPFIPELLLIPSMTGAEGFQRVRNSAKARAIEHLAYIVHSSAVPTSSSFTQFEGQSALLTPNNHGFLGVVREGMWNMPEIVVGIFNLKKLRENRQSGGVWPVFDQLQRSEKPLQIQLVELQQKHF